MTAMTAPSVTGATVLDMMADEAKASAAQLAGLLHDVGYDLELSREFQGIVDKKSRNHVKQLPVDEWLPNLNIFRGDKTMAMLWLKGFSYWAGRLEGVQACVEKFAAMGRQ